MQTGTQQQTLEHAHVTCRIDMQDYRRRRRSVSRCSRRFDNHQLGDIMKTRIAFATLSAAAFLAAVPAAFASVGNIHAPVHAMYFHGEKQIKFSLSNETGAPLELKIGDKVETLQAGQVVPLKLPVGTRITTNTATSSHKVGDLILEVSTSMYSNSTLSIK
jgi:hypothetical protein